jgi:hypothetical protein
MIYNMTRMSEEVNFLASLGENSPTWSQQKNPRIDQITPTPLDNLRQSHELRKMT